VSAKAKSRRTTEETEPAELSRQLLQAQEEERRRITRELHDETGQALMVLRFHLEMLAGDVHTEQQKSAIEESLELLDRAIEGLRRTIARLSPRVLEELGLVAAIRRQAELLTRHTRIRAHLHLPEDLPLLDHDVQVAIYRSVQEALQNVIKHSHARNFTVKLTWGAGRVLLEVEDDGAGFSPRNAQQRGFGLTGMRERAAALGGSMKIRSEPDKGTRIRIAFPLEPDPKHDHRSHHGSVEHLPAA
jgi:signal transduction histidine kinase